MVESLREKQRGDLGSSNARCCSLLLMELQGEKVMPPSRSGNGRC